MFIFIVIIVSGPSLIAQMKTTAGPAETAVLFKANKRSFPCKWRNERINPEFTLLPPSEYARTQQVLDTALNKYPAEVLKKNLKRIHVMQSLRFFGLDFGGTYFKRDIYISNNGTENGYTTTYLEGTFHHSYLVILHSRHLLLYQVKIHNYLMGLVMFLQHCKSVFRLHRI